MLAHVVFGPEAAAVDVIGRVPELGPASSREAMDNHCVFEPRRPTTDLSAATGNELRAK